jgi:hypothetical protein
MKYLKKDYFDPMYRFLEMMKNGHLTINGIRIYDKSDLVLVDFDKPYELTFDIPYEEVRMLSNSMMIHHIPLMGEREQSIDDIEKTNYYYTSCVNCDHPRIDHSDYIGKCNNEDWLDSDYAVPCYQECKKFIAPMRSPIVNSSH